MKKVKLSNSKKWIILVVVFLVLAVVGLSISLAWFTKNTNDDAFELNFANVSIELSDAITGENTFYITNSASNTLTLLMPGDKIYSSIKVTNTGDCGVYYLVCLKSSEINLENDFYFNTDTQISNSINKGMGVLNVGEEHTLNLESVIDKTLTTQGITANFTCSVYAIQSKNITVDTAYNELARMKTSK